MSTKTKFTIHHPALEQALRVPFLPSATVADLIAEFSRRACKVQDGVCAPERLLLANRDGSILYDDEDTLEDALDDCSLPLTALPKAQAKVAPCVARASSSCPKAPEKAKQQKVVAPCPAPKPVAPVAPAAEFIEVPRKTLRKTVDLAHENKGRLIGKQGATKKRIEAEFAVTLTVKKESFTLAGERAAVAAALEACQEAIANRGGQPARKKKPRQPEDALTKANRRAQREAHSHRVCIMEGTEEWSEWSETPVPQKLPLPAPRTSLLEQFQVKVPVEHFLELPEDME